MLNVVDSNIIVASSRAMVRSALFALAAAVVLIVCTAWAIISLRALAVSKNLAEIMGVSIMAGGSIIAAVGAALCLVGALISHYHKKNTTSRIDKSSIYEPINE
jgi:hypothetical protein